MRAELLGRALCYRPHQGAPRKKAELEVRRGAWFSQRQGSRYL